MQATVSSLQSTNIYLGLHATDKSFMDVIAITELENGELCIIMILTYVRIHDH